MSEPALQLSQEQLLVLALQRAVADWVKPEAMALITGNSKKAMDAKRQNGKWPQGVVWDKVDGEVVYSIQGYNTWVNQHRACPQVFVREETPLKLVSGGKESDTTSHGQSRRRRRTSMQPLKFELQ